MKVVGFVITEETTAITKMMIIAMTMKMIPAIEDPTNVIAKKIHATVIKRILAAHLTTNMNANATSTTIAIAEKTASIRLMIAKPIVVIGFLIHGDVAVKSLCHRFHQNRMTAAATEIVMTAAITTIMIQDYLIYTTIKELQWLMFQEFSLIQKKISIA